VPGYEGPERDRSALYNRVTPGYFSVMSTPILYGRDIGPGDRLGTPRVLLVNEAFVKKYFRGENALGRSLTIGDPGTPRAVTGEIVGVVADAKYRTLRETPQPTMYAAWAQEETASSSARISIRVNGTPNSLRRSVLESIESVHEEAVVDFRTLTEDLTAAILQERLVATLSAFFGGLALLLAAIGLYGVMSYTVTRRRGEIGIRMALGAQPKSVMRQVLGNVAWIVTVGLVIGATASYGAERFVNALLFNLVATDKTMVAIAAMALGIAAGVAGYLPARRASRVDPMLALREG
jgi:predicted permease